MTALPAQRLGLTGKGHLGVGADADITIFHYDAIRDRATFDDPALAPEGIDYVLIGGEVVLKNGNIISTDCGKAVRT